MADTDTCPLHAIVEHDFAGHAKTIDDHESRIRRLEAGERRLAMVVGIVSALCSAAGALAAALLKG